ncbi:MAG: DUF1786 domain-containing protein [Candidatus Scalinduaceae bacterium]
MPKKPFRILAIDVGGGTQDILLYEDNKPVENCFKLVLPSQTVIVGKRIEKATSKNKDIFLHGHIMGGGKCVTAIKNHIKKGFRVYSTKHASKTIRDNLTEVQKLGVVIVEKKPKNTISIELKDIDLKALQKVLASFEIEIPDKYAIAVFDHGENIKESNRKFRFKQWEDFIIKQGGLLKDLVFCDVPHYFTRMKSVQNFLKDVILMQTGTAAIWGSLCDPTVKKEIPNGLTIINIGNQHTLAVLIKDERMWGIFEHHTSLLTPKKLKKFVHSLQKKSLKNEDIFKDNGHGSIINPACPKETKFDFITVVGPQRQIADDLDCYYAAPYGDMMLTGCFGLVTCAKSLYGENLIFN